MEKQFTMEPNHFVVDFSEGGSFAPNEPPPAYGPAKKTNDKRKGGRTKVANWQDVGAEKCTR